MSGRFAHLHVHTENSMLDGLGSVQDYVARAKELGHPALAITDHGNLCGAPEFYHACRKAEVEPLIGEEFYFVPDAAYRPAKGEEYDRYHVVLISKGERGYRVLSELSTEAFRRFWHKPLIDRALLEELGPELDHLVCLSGCAASIISKAIQSGDRNWIARELTWWRETFRNFYIEIQHHDTEFDRALNKGLVREARRYGIPWVITNDPHYVVEEDDCHHDALLAIQTASDIDDPTRFRFDGHGYHLRSRQEMRDAFAAYGAGVWVPGAAETLRVARLCHTRIPAWEQRTWKIPRYPDLPEGVTPMEFLRRLTVAGLRKRGLHSRRDYVQRAKRELKVIKQAGVAEYLLITLDIIEEARRRGIRVGPGRGSVCGCLVAYLVGIHKIDSVRYDLLFERFLNPARPRMPDIDTDFARSRRDELYEYATEKYGAENVVHVAAFQKMRLRATFQSLAKAYGVSFPERMRLSKQFAKDDEPEDILPDELQDAHPDLAAQMTRLSGVKKGVSAHPAGIIIASPEDEIRKLVPELYIPSTKRWTGQYDLEAVEEMGLMKNDFLGLKTLDIIDTCVTLIRETTGEDIEPDDWVPDEEPDDDKVFAMLAEGRTAGVFQMTGPANQRGCRDVGPTCFEDIVSVTSLYRTGAISAGFPKIFNENRQRSRRHIKYLHPALKPILERTWGVVLYQEQVMDFGLHLAGFNMVQVDDIKEAIKHKKSTLMDSMKPLFIKGCKEHSGIPESTGAKIWKMIEGYSGYGYNRSHAVAYTMTTYQTARLKCLWPAQFLVAQLTHEDDPDKRDVFLREAIELGMKVVPPDINLSSEKCSLELDLERIRFGLTDIAGVGEKAAAKLLENRPRRGYTAVEQVVEAAHNKGVVEALQQSGALEPLGVKATPVLQEKRLKWTFNDSMERYRRRHRHDVYLPEEGDGEQEVVLIGQIFKIDKGKTKNDKPYLTWKIRWSVTQAFDIRLWSETSSLWGLELGSVVQVTGKWEPKWMNVSVGSPSQVRIIRRVREKKVA